MTRKLATGALLAWALSGPALAQGIGADQGWQEFQEHCAACHGADGRGRQDLPVRPADLTRLMQDNGGVFPTARVYNTIDGRLAVEAHGPRAMPVWGQRYSEEAARSEPDPYLGEAAVRVRIIGLIDYLYQIQARPAAAQ